MAVLIQAVHNIRQCRASVVGLGSDKQMTYIVSITGGGNSQFDLLQVFSRCNGQACVAALINLTGPG
jgi:hypothetical protein